jgi:negative regulator of sigma E activity
MKHDENQFDDLPEALIEELRKSDSSVPLITARVDREVLKLAREQFATRRPAWRRPAWAAVAAAVVLAVVLGPLQMQQHSAPSYSARQPDISDVLRLARESQGTPGAQAEIDALAYQVVSLGSPGESQ